MKCGACKDNHPTVADVRSCHAGRTVAVPPRPIAVAAPSPGVPAGHYALEVDSTLRFYRVDRPTEGKWQGHTFVTAIVGPNEYRIRGVAARSVTQQIRDAGVVECFARYGKEIGRCGVCGLRLTDELSRERGIGPVCYKRLQDGGWL